LPISFPAAPEQSTQKCYALKKPDIPSYYLWKDDEADSYKKVALRKERKKQKWMLSGHDLKVSTAGNAYISDAELAANFAHDKAGRSISAHSGQDGKFFISHYPQPHNTINRLTNTTGTGAFAPYSQEITFYNTDISLVIFALLDESHIRIRNVIEGLTRIGDFGFGKDASIGIGRFTVTNFKEIHRAKNGDVNAVYCLGPCVPERESYSDAFFMPFARFGKHGNSLAQSTNPFKNPVIMADEGAVFLPKNSDDLHKAFFGSAVTGVSKVMPQTVTQGYSITIPFKLEAPK
ncbi:MAG: hypothetical protein AB7V04_14245, partial [Desulfomonilaceae bacterium]